MKQNQFGRSMIEMLGVLAIVGVLSVGGIAGYSKAMEQFKINKMISGYSFLIQELLEYKDNLIKNNPNDGVIFLRDFILAANLIPESFVIAQNSYGLLDSMGNNITPYLNNDSKYLVIDIHMKTTGNGTIDLAYNSCVALFKDIAKPLYHDFVSLRVSLDQENLQYRGSTTCKQAENYRCLVDMTLAEINRVCKVCVTNRNSCTLFMVF